MISVEELTEILNKELNKEFLDTAIELYNDGDFPIDLEHPAMESALEKMADSINDLINTLSVDEYD